MIHGKFTITLEGPDKWNAIPQGLDIEELMNDIGFSLSAAVDSISAHTNSPEGWRLHFREGE